MGGGDTKSESKPVYTAQQEEMLRWLGQNIIPIAEGKETFATKLAAQQARDEGARLAQQQMQGIQELGGQANLGSGQIASLADSAQQQALQATLARVMQQQQAERARALQMLGNIPLSPGTKSKTVKPGGFEQSFSESFGSTLGETLGNPIQSFSKPKIPGGT